MQIITAALLAPLLVQPTPQPVPPPLPEPPAAEPVAPAAIEAPAVTPSEPAVSDAMLHSVEGQRVVLETAAAPYTGVLKAVSAGSVVLALDTGELKELQRTALTGVRLAPAPAEPPLVAPLAAAESPAPVLPPAASCLGDGGCRHPRICVDGNCVLDTRYVDDLRWEGEKRKKDGLITLGVGAGLALIGVIMVPVGFGLAKRTEDGEAETFEEYEALDAKTDRRNAVGFAGSGVLVVGTVLMVAGGIALGVGQGKIRRAARHKKSAGLSVSPAVGDRQLGLRGRF